MTAFLIKIKERIFGIQAFAFNVHGIYPQCNGILSIVYGDSYVKEESLCHTKRTSFSGGSTPLTHLTLMDLYGEAALIHITSQTTKKR